MPREINGKTYYRTAEACERAGISKATLFRWIKSGVLQDVGRKDRNGWRLFSEKDVSRIRSEATKFNHEETPRGRSGK